MDARDLLPLLSDVIPSGATVLAADPDIASALRQVDPTANVLTDANYGPDGADAPGTVEAPGAAGDPRQPPVDVVLLLSGELARAGERAPAVLDRAVRACRPGGWIAAAVPSAVWTALRDQESTTTPGVSAAALTHMLTERGILLRLLAAPGAAARLAGRDWAGTRDLSLDSTPGLLDSGPVVLAVGQTPRSTAERSAGFFHSIARKIVAAAVLCRDEDGRLLLVFDIFKDAWTIPGGLVDADESPIEAAVREAREEGGVEVEAGELLGVFAHPMPDRIHLVYAARPVTHVPQPVPLHDHEIAEVRWVDLDEALSLVDAGIRRRLQACLDQPGGTWHW